LIEAFRLVATEHPEAKLCLVGNGTLREHLLNLAARLGLAERVKILPGRTNLRPLFQEATVFALSSVMEGLPNVVLEAMATGLPVAATRVGAVPESVGRESVAHPAFSIISSLYFERYYLPPILTLYKCRIPPIGERLNRFRSRVSGGVPAG
jgi:glycosyltransferase involved in cell wall biosynthesis